MGPAEPQGCPAAPATLLGWRADAGPHARVRRHFALRTHERALLARPQLAGRVKLTDDLARVRALLATHARDDR